MQESKKCAAQDEGVLSFTESIQVCPKLDLSATILMGIRTSLLESVLRKYMNNVERVPGLDNTARGLGTGLSLIWVLLFSSVSSLFLPGDRCVVPACLGKSI